MKFKEAFEEMKSGIPVKLPSWAGYKDAFIVEKPDNDPELNIGTDGPVEPPINAPYFAGPTRSEQEPSKDNVFNFGFTGVRKHD